MHLYMLVRQRRLIGTCPLLGQALQHAWDMPALGTGPSTCLGQARSWDRPFHMLGTSPLLGQALQHARDKPALGTGPSTRLGQARSWDRPFSVLGTFPHPILCTRMK